MEEALLSGKEEEKWKITRCGFVEELKKMSYMAVPMVAVMVSQYFLQVISVMMVGHLGELALSGVAIGSSFANVTGFSFVFGMAGALETLCGQAYGAEQYQKLGTYTYCSIVSLIPICFPICFVWLFVDKLLVLMGQDPEIAMVAGRYAIWLIPSLLAHPFLQSLLRYFQCQSFILPMFLSSSAALCLHIPLCWTLVYKTKLGLIGAAISTGLALWFNVILLGIYMRYSSLCEKSRAVIYNDIFVIIKEFFNYGVPSAVMLCLEWWSFELLILLSGLLPNSMLETSVLTVCLTITSLHFFVPYGVSAAASTRVSNELGAGNPQAARLSVIVAMVIAAIEPIMVAIILFCCRNVFGYLFSNEKQVVNYVGEMVPLLCISVLMDSLQAVLSGVARGTGWQHIGAYVNLGAYYLVGIPVAAVLCFALNLRGKGLWIGILTGSTVKHRSLLLLLASQIGKNRRAKQWKEFLRGQSQQTMNQLEEAGIEKATSMSNSNFSCNLKLVSFWLFPYVFESTGSAKIEGDIRASEQF